MYRVSFAEIKLASHHSIIPWNLNERYLKLKSINFKIRISFCEQVDFPMEQNNFYRRWQNNCPIVFLPTMAKLIGCLFLNQGIFVFIVFNRISSWS